MTTPTVVPNPGLHLSSYTVDDGPGQRYTSRAVHLCDDCAAKRRANGTMAAKWSGECINGYCDDCGAGPSVSHFRLANPDPTPPVDDGELDNWGGFRAANPGDEVPTENVDVDSTPGTYGPNPGAAIARAFHRDFRGFARRQSLKDEYELRRDAIAYAAYMSARLPNQPPLTPDHVLLIWRMAAQYAIPSRIDRIIEAADASVESYASKL